MQDPAYRSQLPLLAKLMFLSSAIHSLCFVLFSTLPFAVGQASSRACRSTLLQTLGGGRMSNYGQVQDVGLIFLSAMATSVAHECHKAGVSPEATLGTALLTLTGSTLLVGLTIILVGASAC